jgi:hypothetical protein
MNSVNVNIPVVNMPQAVTHQADAHRVPIAHQAQNADLNRDRLDIHLRTANEAEAADGKIINPEDRREEKRNPRKREKDREEEDGEESVPAEVDVAVRMLDNGRLVDLEA